MIDDKISPMVPDLNRPTPRTKGGLTQYLANLGCPDDSLELDVDDGEGAVVQDVTCVAQELEFRVAQKNALELGNVPDGS